MSKKKKKKVVLPFRTNLDKMKKKAEELGTGMYWKAKQGKNTLRILPPWNDEGVFYFEAMIHYGFQVEGRNKAYPCMSMYNEKCPVCEFINRLPEGEKVIKDKLFGRKKFYVNVIDRANPGNISIWGFSTKILRTLLSYIQDPDWGDFTDSEEGHDIVVEREGTGRLDTKYEIRIRPKTTEIGVSGWESKVHNLSSEVIEEVTAEEIEQALEDNYGDANPLKKKKKRKEDDEEEEEEEDEEEEDEDDEKEDGEDEEEEDEEGDDEDEDEDESEKEDEEEDEDDEEEEKPKKKKSKRRRK